MLLGGARSGKSSLALSLARSSERPVVFIATAEARDREMADRIQHHREERPPGWDVIEEPLELAAALADVPGESLAIVDCLSLWVSNLLEAGLSDAQIDGAALSAVERARERAGPTIVVSNEIGLGIVPLGELTRRYRDVLGRLNSLVCDHADRAAFVVAGRALRLDRPEDLWISP